MASEQPEAAIRALVMRYGWNSLSYQILNPGIQHWIAPEAAVGYVEAGGYRVAAGAPLCATERLLSAVRAFEQDARRDGLRVCYFGAQDRLLRAIAEDSTCLRIGAQPVWNPQRWPAILATHAPLRAQLARARNKGVIVERSSESERRPDLDRCLAAWLDGRGLPPMHFLVEPVILSNLHDRLLFVACQHGSVVGFLIATPIPLRGGWLIEQIVRGRGAPNGVAELLLDTAMRALLDRGAAMVTLGLAPLACRVEDQGAELPLLTRALFGWARAHGRRFYNFHGLETFKAKFQPDAWEPVYVISRESHFSLRTLYAIVGAFAGMSPIRFLSYALWRAGRQEIGWALARAGRWMHQAGGRKPGI